MTLGIWLAALAAVALILRRQPIALIVVALGLRLAIPSVALVAFTGTAATGQLQLASWFLLFAVLASLSSKPRMYSAEVNRRFWFYFFLVVTLAAAVIITSQSQVPPAVLIVLLDTLGFGILLCFMIRATIGESAETGRRVALVVVLLACAEAVLAILQSSTGKTLVWEQYMSSYYWWSPTATRVSGSVGAWLDLAFILAVAVPLTAVIRHTLLRLAAVGLLLTALLLSQSRAPFIAAVVCVVIQIFTSRMQSGARLLSAAIVAFGGWALLTSELFTGLASRFTEDDLSTQARVQALDFFMQNIWSQPWTGTGFGSNGFTRSNGLISSFENGYTMYAWDIGLFFTALLIGALLTPLFQAAVRRPLIPGTWLALAVALTLIGLYSGIQTPGPGSWMLFAVVGLCVPRTAEPRSDREPLTHEQSPISIDTTR